MTVVFYSEDGAEIGRLTESPTGLRATGAARGILRQARLGQVPLSDVEIMKKYSDWSNGYEYSRAIR
jgi:hypothetical protein